MTHYRGYAFRIRRMTLSVILRFLYSTGLRTCEARLLTREDVDLQDGVVNISKSKGINQHRIALHPSLWDLLRQYDDAVTRYIPNRKAFFPMSSAIISAEHGCHIISAGFGRCFLMPKQESTI